METTLRSWTPRRPSARLEARLFPQTGSTPAGAAAAAGADDELPFSWQWLAPSMALALMAAFLLGPQTGALGLSSSVPPELFAAAAVDRADPHPDLATYYISARHSANNTPVLEVTGTNRAYALGGSPWTNQLVH